MSQRATATCYCGAVQLEVPVEGEGLVNTHVCNCKDCRKLSVKDTHLKHIRGEAKLTNYATDATIRSGNVMTSSFCSICGTLMYRRSRGFPGLSFCRIGTVDDFELHETKLRPRAEQFVESRVDWLKPIEGAEHVEGMATK